MNFSDKVRFARKELGLTQQQLADAIGVSLRTVNGYENENHLPRTRELYEKLAATLHVSVNYLRTEDAAYPPLYGNPAEDDPLTSRAWDLVQEIRCLFGNSAITEEVKEEVMHGISEAYWVSRRHG